MGSNDDLRGFSENFRASVYRIAVQALGLSQEGSDNTPPEDLDKEPLVVRITEVYWTRVRDTGLGEKQATVMRSELKLRVAECVNHFQSTAPEDMAHLERMIKRYDHLREAAGINRKLLEEPPRLLPGFLGHVQAVAEALLGAIPALIGFVTGFLPQFVTRAFDRRSTRTEQEWGGPTGRHILVGVLSFSLFYGGLIGLVWWWFSDAATVLLAVLLIPAGLFARSYARRIRTIVAHLGDRTASWFKLNEVARLRATQDELVLGMDLLRNRYRVEVLGWDPLPPHFKRKSTLAAVARVLVIGFLTAGALLFIRGYVNRPVQGLPLGASAWQATRTSDPVAAERELLRDARGVLLAAQQLDYMQEQMVELRADFLLDERDLLNQEDQDQIHSLLLAYLDLRSALLKTVGLYRGENTEAAVTTEDPLEARAFLTAYTAATLLVEKAWLIYDTFRDDPRTRQQLDLGDLAWSIPPGTFSNIESSLSNEVVMAELQMATRRFESDREQGRIPQGTPWGDLAVKAERARPALDEVFDGIGRRRLRRTFREMVREIRAPVTVITTPFSIAISRFRLKERPPHEGLISRRQLEDLRAELRPGDILIERRNWYISNSLLPGFWPHAALYLGSFEELADLGIVTDPRVVPHMSDFQGQDELGDDFAVLEAIADGVVFTSLEQSVGEADAVAVLRPKLSKEDLSEALGRALSHRGKGYDFDADFETTDRLVCTELIFRAYDDILQIPDMRIIMGKPRISANDYVRIWADGRESDDPQLELVRFLDSDEPNGVAVEANAETLVETLERSRFAL